MPAPELAVLVSSFERPRHLERSLASIAAQRERPANMEVVVTDDGSRDATGEVVERFAASAPFPVRMTTHPHDGFQLARCRNEGVAASTAEKILFLDGDCVIPPDHLARFMKRLRPGLVLAGFCVWLDEATSERVTLEAIRSGEFVAWAPASELKKLAKLYRKSRLYNWLRHPTKPHLFGGDIGICRADYERINGYDEAFVGWGCEDDDLRVRLRRDGVRIESILNDTRTYHLWHPPAASRPAAWKAGANVARHQRRARLTTCLIGLKKRSLQDLRIAVVGAPADDSDATRHLPSPGAYPPPSSADRPEIEVAYFPTADRFSGRADCNILVLSGAARRTPSRRLLRDVDAIISTEPIKGATAPRFSPSEFREALRSVA